MIEKLKELCDSLPGRVDEYIWDKEVFGEVEGDHYSGGEGEGEDYREVFHLKDHNIHIEVAGHYQSYSGVDYWGEWEDHVYQVYPAVSLDRTYSTKPQTKEDLLVIQKKVSELLDKLD